MTDQLISFKEDSAFSSKFAYQLFLHEAKRHDAYHKEADKTFVKQDWLSQFARNMDVTPDYKLRRYEPAPRVYAPSTFVSLENLLPVPLTRAPYEYKRNGILSPIVNHLSPEVLTFYTHSASVESERLFKTVSVGTNSLSVMDSDFKTLPINLKNEIDTKGIKYIVPEIGLLAIYIYPNIVMLTHKFNRGIHKLHPKAIELYEGLFQWVQKVHIDEADISKNKAETGDLELAIATMLTYMDNTVEAFAAQIRENLEKITIHQESIFNLYQENESKQLVVSQHAVDKKSKVAAMIEEVQKTAKLDMVKKVEFTADKLIVRTNVIESMPDYNGNLEARYGSSVREKYKELFASIEEGRGIAIPETIIEIPYANNGIKIRSANSVDSITGFWSGPSPHPHINHQGNPCWGTASGSVAELHAKQEWSMLIVYIINYLKTCNPSDPAGATFYLWPLYKDEAIKVTPSETEETIVSQ